MEWRYQLPGQEKALNLIRNYCFCYSKEQWVDMLQLNGGPCSCSHSFTGFTDKSNTVHVCTYQLTAHPSMNINRMWEHKHRTTAEIKLRARKNVEKYAERRQLLGRSVGKSVFILFLIQHDLLHTEGKQRWGTFETYGWVSLCSFFSWPNMALHRLSHHWHPSYMKFSHCDGTVHDYVAQWPRHTVTSTDSLCTKPHASGTLCSQ